MGLVNLISCLLPDLASVRLEAWSIEPAPTSITVPLRSKPYRTQCPLCREWSEQAHCRYEGTLADLSWGDMDHGDDPSQIGLPGHLAAH
jgi:hypothetical protein